MKNLIKNFVFFICAIFALVATLPSCTDDGMLDDVQLDSTQVDRYNDFTGDSASIDDSLNVGDVIDSVSQMELPTDTTNLLGIWYLSDIIRDTVSMDISGNLINLSESDTIPLITEDVQGSYYHNVRGNELPNMIVEEYIYKLVDTVVNGDSLLVPIFTYNTYDYNVDGSITPSDNIFGYFEFDYDKKELKEYFNQENFILGKDYQEYTLVFVENTIHKKYLVNIPDSDLYLQYTKVFFSGEFIY